MIKIALALTLASVVVGSASVFPTRHDAKVRTFKALLRITELRPDVEDATHAAVTVGGCQRRTYGFRCEGSLSPVLISGIPGSTCKYTAYVYPRSIRLSDGNCG